MSAELFTIHCLIQLDDRFGPLYPSLLLLLQLLLGCGTSLSKAGGSFGAAASGQAVRACMAAMTPTHGLMSLTSLSSSKGMKGGATGTLPPFLVSISLSPCVSLAPMEAVAPRVVEGSHSVDSQRTFSLAFGHSELALDWRTPPAPLRRQPATGVRRGDGDWRRPSHSPHLVPHTFAGRLLNSVLQTCS